MFRSRASLRWASVGLMALVLAATASAQSDFGFYPEGARDCLYRAAAQTDCEESGNVPEMNECFCSNGGGFIINAATCVGEEAGNDVVQDTYAVMQEACSNSDTPMSISQSDFFAAADGEDVDASTAEPTTSGSEPTSTETDSTSTQTESTSTETESQEPTSTETEAPAEETGDNSNDDNSSEEDGGLSQGATIGIGVGAGVGGLALIGALAAFLIRRRKRQTEESNPMLPTSQVNHHSNAPTTFPPQSPSPGYAFTDAKTSPSTSPYPSSNHTHSGAWQSPPLFQGQQQQQYQAYPPPSSSPEHQQRFSAYAPHHAYPADALHGSSLPHSNAPVEIDGMPHNVAEMPGSAPPPTGRIL